MAGLTRADALVLLPAYNEAGRLKSVIAEIRERGFLILAVDDGSSDATPEILRTLGVEFLRNEKNEGKGAALRRGITYFLKNKPHKALVMMDADGQHEPSELDRFLTALDPGKADLVVGNRMTHPESMPFERRATNRFLSGVISMVAGQRVPDSQCGYRAVTRECLEHLSLRTAHYEIESEIILEAARHGFRIASIDIRSVYAGGQSKIRPLRDTRRFFSFLFSYLVTRSH